MPTFEVEINGQKFEIDAPDEAALSDAIGKMQTEFGSQSAAADENGGIVGALNSFGTGIADMATSGFADEIGAGARWLGGKVLPWQSELTYDEALQEVRGKDKAAAEANPISHSLGQLVGGVGTASALAKNGATLTGRLATDAALKARVGAGVAEGALMGAGYGFGSGEGLEDRMWGAAKDAALGGAIGGAVPLVVSGATSAYRSLADRRAANAAAEAAGIDPDVARVLRGVTEGDGTFGARGQSNMAAAGKEAMIADAGTNARQLLDASIQRSGPGANLAQDRIGARVSRGAKDLTAALDDALGTPAGVETAKEGIRRGTSSARGAAYREAYNTPINYADPRAMEIEGLVKSRVPASAIRRANELMRLEGEQSRQILAKMADDGSVTFEALPDVMQLDYITRALNDVANDAQGTGALGGTSAIGRAYENLSRDIRSNLRGLVPEYGKALETAADPIGRVKALDLGQRVLSPSMTRDDVARAVKGMTGPEKEALKQSIRTHIDDTIANVTRAVQDGDVEAREAIKAIKSLSSRANREKLSGIVGEKQAARLFGEVDRIATSFDLRAAVADNSKTQIRNALQSRVGDLTAEGPFNTLKQGEPIKAGKRLVQLLTGRTPEVIKAQEDRVYGQIVDLLTRGADQSLPAFKAMTDYGAQSAAIQDRAARLAKLLSYGQRGVYPLTTLSAENMR